MSGVWWVVALVLFLHAVFFFCAVVLSRISYKKGLVDFDIHNMGIILAIFVPLKVVLWFSGIQFADWLSDRLS